LPIGKFHGAKAATGPAHLGARLGKGLALFHGGDAGHGFGPLAQQRRGLLQHRRPRLGRRLAPHLEALGRGVERPVEVGRVGEGQLTQGLAGRGVDEGVGAAMADTHPLAGDVHVKRGEPCFGRGHFCSLLAYSR
jgi:hypothetical protein